MAARESPDAMPLFLDEQEPLLTTRTKRMARGPTSINIDSNGDSDGDLMLQRSSHRSEIRSAVLL